MGQRSAGVRQGIVAEEDQSVKRVGRGAERVEPARLVRGRREGAAAGLDERAEEAQCARGGDDGVLQGLLARVGVAPAG